jgi:NAD+ synthase
MNMTEAEARAEANHITAALREWLAPEARAVVGLSGGLDSDVVARLLVQAIGKQRLKLFTVIQDGMEPCHLEQARDTAADLALPLAEINLMGFPERFIAAMRAADSTEAFMPQGLLDPARAKCSLRTPVLSTYQDRGYCVIGTSNRTEIETGFFLPLGDAIWHFGPIAHLYKSEVMAIARVIGTSEPVLRQPPSAGFWPGQEDLEDLSYWLLNAGPIGREREFTDEDVVEVERIRSTLTIDRVDRALLALRRGLADAEAAAACDLELAIVEKLRLLTAAAARTKHRALGVRLPNRIS